MRSSLIVVLLITVLRLTTAIEGAETAVHYVGPGKAIAAPSAAARVAKDGDVIEIEAGTYEADVATWTQNNLTIHGVGGRVYLKANGAHAAGKGIWVISGRNTTIEDIVFSGARVPARNGAGIRLDGAGLTVRNCKFMNNENGILGGGGGDGDVVIEHSEFASNGYGDGQSHNIYIGNVRTFTFRGNYVHHANVGHNVKSRAQTNYILYNRIMDEWDGTASYAVDLSNGGLSYLIGNLIQKGPHTRNPTMIAFGAEGLANPVNELYVVNNTLVNDQPEWLLRENLLGSTFIRVWGVPQLARVINNLFIGQGVVLKGLGELTHNLTLTKPVLLDPAAFDYRLKSGSAAIRAGIDPGVAHGFSLRPTSQYVHLAQEEPRPAEGHIDVGAYQYPR
jgi:hypothetical protein